MLLSEKYIRSALSTLQNPLEAPAVGRIGVVVPTSQGFEFYKYLSIDSKQHIFLMCVCYAHKKCMLNSNKTVRGQTQWLVDEFKGPVMPTILSFPFQSPFIDTGYGASTCGSIPWSFGTYGPLQTSLMKQLKLFFGLRS